LWNYRANACFGGTARPSAHASLGASSFFLKRTGRRAARYIKKKGMMSTKMKNTIQSSRPVWSQKEVGRLGRKAAERKSKRRREK